MTRRGHVDRSEQQLLRPTVPVGSRASQGPHNAVMGLQQSAGNRAVAQLLEPGRCSPGHSAGQPAVQRTMQDLLAAANYWRVFQEEVGRAGNVITNQWQTIGKYYRGYDVVQQHPDELVEAASTGLHHDAKEVSSKAGGYLHQQIVQEAFRHVSQQYAFVHAGSSNKKQSDIFVHNIPPGVQGPDMPRVVEAKRTITDSYRASLRDGIEQLSRRRDFPLGTVTIEIRDPDLIQDVLTRPKAVTDYANDMIGVNRRAFANTKYVSVDVEITSKGNVLFKQTFNPKGQG